MAYVRQHSYHHDPSITAGPTRAAGPVGQIDDEFEERQYYASMMFPAVCPECAFLEAGTCKWCPNDAPEIPGCEGCIDRKKKPPPWYERSEILVPMATAVVTAVISAIVTSHVMTRIGPRT